MTFKRTNPKLPPLQALRAFEAAARLGSFKTAALELHVTPAAISHQIKLIEKAINRQLFSRGNRTIALTPAGQLLYADTQVGLEKLREGLARLQTNEERGPLFVSCSPSLAAMWLAPRLPDFHKHYPHITVVLEASGTIANFADGLTDVAIRFGHGRYPGHMVAPLMDIEFFPVCRPRLATKLRCLQDLQNVPLIDFRGHNEEASQANGWAAWCKAAGEHSLQLEPAIIMAQTHLAVSTVKTTDVVTLAAAPLVIDDLKLGTLKRPFQPLARSPYRFFTVSPPEQGTQHKVRAFTDWLQKEAAETRNLIKQLLYR